MDASGRRNGVRTIGLRSGVRRCGFGGSGQGGLGAGRFGTRLTRNQGSYGSEQSIGEMIGAASGGRTRSRFIESVTYRL
jgi:hypothetical protein